MRISPLWALAAAGLVFTACKDPEQVAEVARLRTAAERVEQARAYLDQGRPDLAIPELKAAASALPEDPQPRIELARAHRALGNDAAAILSLKEAVELTRGNDPRLRQQLAELLLQEGHVDQAVPILVELRDQHLLTDAETLRLARVQARAGDAKGAFLTLERIQRVRPDDLDAKLAEAEVLLWSHQEDLAWKILDRLDAEQAAAPQVKLVRARYFLATGEAQKASDELTALQDAAASLEVSQLRAEVLCALERYEEADSALGHLIEERPRDPDLLSRLAEVKLNLGAVSTAEMLVEQALGARPRDSRALYVRGRILEAQNELDRAKEQFQRALDTDAGFSPALSRLWRIHQAQGQVGEAMSALERLLFMGRASLEEKVALAELYAGAKTQQARARTLVAEALRQDPANEQLLALKKKLGTAPSKKRGASTGVEVIQWKRR